MDYAVRNRLIKKLLTDKFGKGKVRVYGSRGTAYGWCNVKIDYAPLDLEERDTLVREIWEAFDANQIKIGTYGYDDPGSDYGYGKRIHIDFEPLRNRLDAWQRSAAAL